ncbi:MAG: hypothetical protein KDI15_13160, partial [Thiothrix sp.]|nr:hypothetical protein [Thiothrix sp.]
RKVYVDAAEAALYKAGEKTTTSRIAIATGLTRKEVAQLRQLSDSDQLLGEMRYNRGVRVISGWRRDADFLDENGMPRSLPIQGDDARPGFEQLVSRYSGDMPCRAMLNELLQNGLVDQQADGLVALLSNAYIPQAREEEQLAILGTDVRLLLESISHNLDVAGTLPERRFQRKVCYDNLPPAVVSTFRELANSECMDLLLRLNTWLATHDRDSNPAPLQVIEPGRLRAGVGIYYFEEPVGSQTRRPEDGADNV